MATFKTAGGNNLLQSPSDDDTYNSVQRAQAEFESIPRFRIKERTYQQQFSDIYFLRLTKLKPQVDKVAEAAWDDLEIQGEKVNHVERVLDVRQGEFCWMSGTVYMDMPLKPNILEDISKDHFIIAPPAREKFTDPDHDQVMLEDESGRLRLVGGILADKRLVTGCVIAVMGSETANGDFEVIDVKIPDLPPQKKRPVRKGKDATSKKVALISGLSIRGEEDDSLETHLLVEWLVGELGGEEDSKDAAKISRLILAGNSLAAFAPLPSRDDDKKLSKKYGYDAAAYDPSPTMALDALLASILPSLPVTIMPGDSDPANVSLPQQPLHPALFPNAKAYLGSVFETGTNPWTGSIDGVKFLGTAGQNLNDIYKYVEGEDRLGMAERMLRWRVVAPTAPDTLWSYPFQNEDQYVIEECPQVYFIGNQPKFDTELIEGPDGQSVRIVLIPKFSETGEIVLLDLDTLECEIVEFKVDGLEKPNGDDIDEDDD
ncbi:DNA polymerase delta small subunit Cdc1 [Rhizina undulata]